MYYSKCLLFWVMWLFEQIFKTYIPTDPYFNSMATWNRHILGLIWNPVKWRSVASDIELVSSGNQAVIMYQNTPVLTYIFKYTIVNKYYVETGRHWWISESVKFTKHIQMSLLSPVGTVKDLEKFSFPWNIAWFRLELNINKLDTLVQLWLESIRNGWPYCKIVHFTGCMRKLIFKL